jgi:5'-nucleotidase
MQSRKQFVRNATLAAGAILSPGFLNAFAGIKHFTILHTNDTHSRMEPFPMDGSKYQGLGGVAARSEMIHSVRQQEAHVLLLDAGDVFQGTPYFNMYKGEPEMKAMQRMGYDAMTLGNHDFDGGIENLASQLVHINFPVIVCNYDFTGTAMEHKTIPYHIINKGGLKIGITGVGIQLEGLVSEELSRGVRYYDPVQKVNEYASVLKSKGCDLVICLSHLGYEYKNTPEKISDVKLAADSDAIDLIIGGHTHTFLDSPVTVINRKGDMVLINQVGWGGIQLGRLDYELIPGFPNKSLKKHKVFTLKKTTE